MVNLEQQIQAEVEGYQGPHQELIACAPFFFRMLTRILEDPELPARLRPLVLVTIAYFLMPADTISEDLTGPRGYLDDLFLTAMTADAIAREMASGELLERNWEGDGSILSLIRTVLSKEKDLIGDQREVMLWYTGFEHLV